MGNLTGDSNSYIKTTEQKFRWIAEQGFDGINAFVPGPEDKMIWQELLAHYDLSLSVNAYPSSLEEMRAFVNQATQYGGISYINAQVMCPFLVGDSAIELLSGIYDISLMAGIPIYVETHRGTITQDLMRTASFLKSLPSLPLTMDYSHYVVAGELHTISEEAENWLKQLLPNIYSIHTRISNGEQIQIDPGEEGQHPMLPHFLKWWEIAMKHAISRSEIVPYDSGIFPVVIELGPPPYAITYAEPNGSIIEVGDRLKQSLHLQQLIRKLWDHVQ